MSQLGPNWYSADGLRGYPVADGATREDDAGATLPADLVVDLSVRWPDDLGAYAFLGAAARGPGLVSVVVLACPAPDSAAGATAIAACTVPRARVRPDRIVPLTPLAAGAGGWVVFGPPGPEPYAGRFSSPLQTLLTARAARAYRRSPVRSATKEGVGNPLTGLVRLTGRGDVEVVSAVRTIDGKARTVAVIRLLEAPGKNVYDLYRGPCGVRPESGTCPLPPVQSIGGVGPDCDGNVSLVFVGGGVQVTPVPAGVVVDLAVDLAAACAAQNQLPDATGTLPGRGDPTCTGQAFEGSTFGDPGYGGSLPGDLSNTSMSSVACSDLPVTDDFTTGAAAGFTVELGTWTFDHDYGSSSSPGEVGTVVWRTTASGGRAVAVWPNCPTGGATSIGKRAACVVAFNALTSDHFGPAGLVVNRHLVGAGLTEQYFFPAVNMLTSRFELLFWNGTYFATIAASGSLALHTEHRYQIRCDVTLVAGEARLDCTLTGLDDAVSAEIVTETNLYDPADGFFGVGAYRCTADFTSFSLDNI